MALPQFLLNLLFPPRCPFCDRPVEAVVSAPCPHCQGSDVWLEGAQAVVTGEAFARCVCAGWYREPLRASLRRFKFSGRRDYAKAYGPVLAQAVRTYLPGTYDLITWVPVSPETLRSCWPRRPPGPLPPKPFPCWRKRGTPRPSPP